MKLLFNKYERITKLPWRRIGAAALMALLPLVCCVIHCGIQGRFLWEVYLPVSEWNDELFYFKQVEGILEHGYPYGYFGFNESRAARLSFAAWSPVLVLPWVLWGSLFGWNLLSPVWCNLFLMSAAVFVFVLLTKPEKKQLGALAVMYCLFPMFTRYILSGMPEIICISLVIMFYGVAHHYLKRGATTGKLILLFAMAVLMTLMRPYMLLFLFLPAFLWILKSRKWWSVVGSMAIMLGTFGGYVMIHTLLGAEYLEPLFSVEWLDVMLEEGLLPGLKFIVYMILNKGMQFTRSMLEGFRSGFVEGVFFAVFTVAAILLTVQFVQEVRRKKKEEMILCGHAVFAFLGMLAALLLMYLLHDGRRHLITFVAAAIFLLCLMETRYFAKIAVMGILCLYLFLIKGDSPYDYQVPFRTPEKIEQMAYWEDAFDREIKLNRKDVPNYDNVVIWVLSDSKKK